MDDARETLIDVALDLFGTAPGDLFAGIIRPAEVLNDFRDALNVFYTSLRDLAKPESSENMPSPAPIFPDRTVCIYPRYSEEGVPYTWYVDFASSWIARMVSAELADDPPLANALTRSVHCPWAQTMVCHMFEPHIHRMFTSVAPDTPCQWPLLQMHRVEGMTFTVDPSSAALSPRVFPTVLRARKEFSAILPTSLRSNTYYIPIGTTLPPVDAFAVDYDKHGCAATLWLLRLMTSEKHDESGRGSRWIRRLVKALQDKVTRVSEGRPPTKEAKLEVPPTVAIHFVLVTLMNDEPGPRVAWKMPQWWDDDVGQVAEGGDVYLLQFPIKVRTVHCPCGHRSNAC